jgi:hypothetical protein
MVSVQVRFHIMSERELREKKSGTGHEADSQLNFQQLSKSLLTLLNLYDAVDAEGGSGWLHEAEFYGYYVLLNLGDRDQFKVGMFVRFPELIESCYVQLT